jgi:hypothetical protein
LGVCQTPSAANLNSVELAFADKQLHPGRRHPVWQSSWPMRNREPEPVLGVDVHLDRPCGPAPREWLAAVRAVSAAAALLCAALLACLAAPPAGAAPELSWHLPSAAAVGPLSAVACATRSACVAVSASGRALFSADPASGAWSAASPDPVDPGHALTSVSCAPGGSLCVAVDDDGRAFVSSSSGATWSGALEIDGSTHLTGVSCASTASCVAVDEGGEALFSSTPSLAGSWSAHAIDGHTALTSVSCAPGLPCVAVDLEGKGFASANPSTGAWEEIRAIHPGLVDAGLAAVGCAPSPADVCAAVNHAGEVLASGNPLLGATASWSTTPLETVALTGVSCEAAGLCVAIDHGGRAYFGDGPAGATPSWTPPRSIDSPEELTGVSCVAEGLCAVVDQAGKVLVGEVPAPIVATEAPPSASVAETAASLTGTVDTNDALLSSCRLEYGTSEAYGQSAPCPALGPGSAAQPVGFFLTGLAPNVTYDYRLAAVSASGEARTANTTFKTPAPPLVQPHPSIGGIPAPGQRLTCKSGVSGSSGASSATLSYAWLRDTKAISGASGSTYVVASADVTHHLQCRVTATNAGGSASATSAFVTVPAGGIGAISETQVGSPRVAGRTVSVSLTCSTQAAGSCTIALRLSVVETLRGSRVVAVAARRGARLAEAAPARRTSHKTVSVGAVTVHVPAGQRRTVTVALNTTGRRLLASLHKLTAKLSVSGTVVGAISAQLRSATVTFGGGAGKASSSRKAAAGKARSRRGR